MSESTFAYYPVFARSEIPLEQDVQEVERLLEKWDDRVQVRGTYATGGFRSDADMMMWWVAPSADDVQDLLSDFLRTAMGSRLRLARSFMGLVRPAEFSKDHLPAFLKGEPPRKYLCVYPFVRTPEWYLLPRDERAEMLREHGEIGREFPEVLANTTSAFGLSDWEWILAFESDHLDRLVDCIRRLRDAKARRYTKEETPFITGIRKDLAGVVRSMS